LSRSSNDHNNGDKQPKSNNIQAIHNKPLNIRVNSNKINRQKLTRMAKKQRKLVSKQQTNK